MKLTQTQIVGIVVGFLILAAAAWAYSKWKSTKNKQFVEEIWNGTPEDQIPEAVQKELPGFDEGEILTYQGVNYQVIGGKWFKI